MLSRFRAYIILSFFSLFLLACAGEEAPPPQPKAPAKPPEAKVEAKKVEEAAPEAEIPFTYDPKGKPEPFKPFVEIPPPETAVRRPPLGPPSAPKAPVARARRAPTVPPSPLQKFEIDQLKLVGIVWQVDEGRDLIEDPGGRGYIVGPGTPMGLKNGIIIKIEPDKVIIEEEEEDVEGRVSKKEVVMRLGGK